MGRTRKHGIAKGGNDDFCIRGGIVANTEEETAPSGEASPADGSPWDLTNLVYTEEEGRILLLSSCLSLSFLLSLYSFISFHFILPFFQQISDFHHVSGTILVIIDKE